MKKYLKYILIISIFSFFQSCGKHSNQNDLEKMNLKGDVILIKDGVEYIFFNDKGNIIKKYNDFNTENISIGNYFYIENKLSKIITLFKSSNQNKTYNNEIQETFNYDNDGNLITSVGQSDQGGSWNVFYFYEKGKLVKDSVQQQFIGYSTTRVNTFIYNGESLIRRDFNEKSFGNFPITYKHIYFYENGLETKKINDDNSTSFYEYENDMKGNWVKQKQSDGEVFKREIFYKGDDISLFENKYEELKKEISSSSSETNYIQDPTSNNEVVPQENNYSNQNQQTERQKQWVNCNKCKGTGKIVCDKCNGTTLMFCGTCDGRGTFNSGNGSTTCYYCKGALKVKCDSCYGKGIKGNCGQCGGRGQVQQ
jgi:hypothetical protein